MIKLTHHEMPVNKTLHHRTNRDSDSTYPTYR